MKRLQLIISIFLIFVFSVNASAQVKIDGIDNGIEWQNSQYFLLINEAKINNVGFAYAKTHVSSVYEVEFLLFLSDGLSESYENVAFILTVNDDLEIKVSSDGVAVDGDSAEYYVEAKMNIKEEDGASCEIRVGFKRGLPEEIFANACFVDGNGNHSYYYPVTVVNPLFVEENETSDSFTTKNPTTNKTTEKRTEKPEATEKNNPTEKTTAKQKSTQKSADKTVVYFYEKEIIVSQVYGTDNGLIEPDYITDKNDEIIPTHTDVTRLSNGIKIQRIVCIAGGALLLGLGAWASISGKRKNTEVKSDSEQKDESTDE